MFNVNKGSKPPVVRLPTLQAMPTEELIRQLLVTLHDNPGRTVVLPWTPGGVLKPMCLTVNQLMPNRDLIKKDHSGPTRVPDWVLYNGTEPEGQPIWSQSTIDLAVVLDQLLSEWSLSESDYQAMQPGMNLFGNQQGSSQQQRSGQPSSSQPVFQQPAPAAAPSAIAPDPNAFGMNLSGNVRDVELTSVLQSITLCKMVGKLEVNDTLKAAELYFDDGVLVHAVGQHSVLDENSKYNGDTVLLDTLTWEQGSFKFHSGLKTPERTVKRRLEAMLMEGAALRDYSKSLSERGFHMDTTLMKVHPQLTEQQFEHMVAQGAPLDITAQKTIYLQIGNGASTEQILQVVPMPKTVWMPIIFNLVNCQILRLAEGAVQRAPRPAGAIQIDYTAMEMAYRELLRPETSMLSYPLFLYFLTQEFARFKKSGMPFSLAVFELKHKRNGNLELLSNEALKQIGAQLEKNMQGQLVYFSHFGIVDFAMLLPCSIGIEAEQMGHKLLAMLHAIELEGIDKSQLHFAIGTSCVPDDCEDIEKLLNLAVQRRHELYWSAAAN